MSRNKMALEHICVIFFVLCMTLVNCKTYPPRIESICLHDCVYSLKYYNFEKYGHMRQAKLEEICKKEDARFYCELKWEYDEGMING